MIDLINSGYYVSKNYFKGEITPLREVTSYEIELFATDAGISIINGAQYPHKPGNILVALPGDKRRTIRSFECHSVKFLTNNSEDIQKYITPLAGVTNMAETKGLASVFNAIYRAASKPSPGGKLYIDAKIRELIAGIYNMKNTYNNPEFPQYIKNICESIEFIKKNFMKNITLNAIASVSGLSPSFFHKVFKNITGKTPWEYLNLERIGNAKFLLENSGLTIDDIASKCGFSSRQYFDTVFKKETGETPASFRKSCIRII